MPASPKSQPAIRFRLPVAGWLIVVLSLAIVGASIVHNVNFLRLLFAMVVALFVLGSWFGRRQLTGLTLRRSVPKVAEVGQTVCCLLEIASRRSKPAFGISILDRVRPRNFALRAIRLATIAPRETVRRTYEFTTSVRGEYRFGPAKVASAFPFGFVEWMLPLAEQGVPDTLLAYPRLGTLRLGTRRQLGLASLGAGRASRSLIEGMDECRGVRDYRDGDPPRLIHWRSTARRGTFVVRELEPAAAGNLLVIVEPRFLQEYSNPLGLIETVLAFTATMVVEICRSAPLELTLLVADRVPFVVRGAARPHRLPAYLRPLTIAGHTTEACSIAAISRMLRTTDTRDRQLWFISTTEPPKNLSESLASAGLRQLSTRHLLNASAGDLERHWIGPESKARGSFDSEAKPREFAASDRNNPP